MAQTLRQTDHRPERDFHGAAVVTADGGEVPITEDMVARSLETLEASWRAARRRSVTRHAR